MSRMSSTLGAEDFVSNELDNNNYPDYNLLSTNCAWWIEQGARSRYVPYVSECALHTVPMTALLSWNGCILFSRMHDGVGRVSRAFGVCGELPSGDVPGCQQPCIHCSARLTLLCSSSLSLPRFGLAMVGLVKVPGQQGRCRLTGKPSGDGRAQKLVHRFALLNASGDDRPDAFTPVSTVFAAHPLG